MSIEYIINSHACNISCKYCYQDAMRDAGAINVKRDWERAKAALDKENYRFTVFGGEPLLTPIEHLEEVFKFSVERFGRDSRRDGMTLNGIQTNGTLITDEHIKLFQKYDVAIGFSVDGPGALNDARAKGAETRKLTAATIRNMAKCREAGLQCNVIVTLHKLNATEERLPILLNWFRWLEKIGFNSIGLHLLEVETPEVRAELALTDEENIHALLTIWKFADASTVHFNLFEDLVDLLVGNDHRQIHKDTSSTSGVSCIWNACDPQTTRAVHGVGPDGARSNCGRTNKSGINYIKASTEGLERYIILGRTPQSVGGCKDCKFFLFCKGNCPGTAIDGDWRNRSEHCRVWYALLEEAERRIISTARLPLTREKSKMLHVRKVMEAYWRSGRFISIAEALKTSEESLATLEPIRNQNHIDTHEDAHDDVRHIDTYCDSEGTFAESDRGIEVEWI